MRTFSKVLTGATVVVLVFLVYLLYGGNLRLTLLDATVQSASERVEAFENIRSAARRGDASVAVFVDDLNGSPDEYAFVTLTYDVLNWGLLPAEWVELSVAPNSGDILTAGGLTEDIGGLSRTQLSVAVLTRADHPSVGHVATLSYYILGRQRSAQSASG